MAGSQNFDMVTYYCRKGTAENLEIILFDTYV